jgi:hypothetical protein
MTDEISGVARATYCTKGVIGTGNAEFSEPDEENIFCLNPNSQLNRGPGALCFVDSPGLTKLDSGLDYQEILIQANSGRPKKKE